MLRSRLLIIRGVCEKLRGRLRKERPHFKGSRCNAPLRSLQVAARFPDPGVHKNFRPCDASYVLDVPSITHS